MTFTQWTDDYFTALTSNPDIYLSFDIETVFRLAHTTEDDEKTTDQEGAILRISFAYQPYTGVSIPFSPPYFANIRRLLESSGRKVVWNGVSFDIPRLAEDGFKVCGTVYEGMDAQHMFEPDLPKGLEWSTADCTDMLPWKHLSQAQPALYSAIDADAALRNMLELEGALKRRGQWQAFLDHSVALMPILVRAGAKGNKVDVEAQSKLRIKLTEARVELLKEAQPLVPREVKPRKLYKTCPDSLVGGDSYEPSVSAHTARAVVSHALDFDIIWEPEPAKFCSHCGRPASNKTAHFAGTVGPNNARGKPTKIKNPCKLGGGVISTAPAFVPRFYQVLDFNPNSPDQLKRYIQWAGHKMGQDRKTKKPNADAKHIEHLIKLHGAKHPIYAMVLEVHKLSKVIGTYLPEPDANGVIHTEYTNCVPGDHQVLTPTGWVELRSLSEGTPVAQWEQDTRAITFVQPSAINRGLHTGKLIEIKGTGVDLEMTPAHRVPLLITNGCARVKTWQTVTADNLPDYGQVPVNGLMEGLIADTGWARLAVAVQADGHVKESGQIQIGLTRVRKQVRLRALLAELNVSYEEQLRPSTGQISFVLARHAIDPMWRYLTTDKAFIWPAFFALTLSAKQVVLDETLLWDGHIRGKGKYYTAFSNTHKANVELMQALAHVSGNGASWAEYQPEMPHSNRQYHAQFNHKQFATLHRLKMRRTKTVQTPMFVYCVEVPSSYFLVRHNGRVCITGNSPSTWRLGSRKVPHGTQIQNWGHREDSNKWAFEARSTIIASPGCKLVEIDSSSVEAVMLGWFMGDVKYIELASQGVHDWLVCQKLGWAFNPDTVAKIKVEHKQLRNQMKMANHMCLTGDHEVLTPEGWVRFDKYDFQTPIAEWNPQTQALDFQSPKGHVNAPYDGEMLDWEGRAFSASMTPNHHLPVFYDSDQAVPYYTEAQHISDTGRLPVTGTLTAGIDEDPTLLRLVVATQADAHVEVSGTIRFHFKRQRKIDRMRELLQGRVFTERVSKAGVTTFRISYKHTADILSWLSIVDKTFDFARLMTLSPCSRQVVLDEVTKWDGSENTKSGRQTCYVTMNRRNAETIQTLAHVTGHQALLRQTARGMYVVSFNRRKCARVGCFDQKVRQFSGRVYCVTTSTGYFLVRRNKKVWVSGNTNYGGTAYALWQSHPSLFTGKNDAQQVQDFIFDAIPKLKAYQHNVRWRAQREGYLETPWHIRHPFYDVFTISEDGTIKDGKDAKRVVAFEPQSSNGTFQRDNLRLVDATPFGQYLPAIANVHDSLGLDCPDAVVDAAVEQLAEIFTRPIPQMGGLRVGAEVSVGSNWGDYHPVKNPNGMKSVLKRQVYEPGLLRSAA